MKHFNFDLYKESKQYFQLFDVYIKQFEKNKENVFNKLNINNSSYRRARDNEQTVGREIIKKLSDNYDLKIPSDSFIDKLEKVTTRIYNNLYYKVYDTFDDDSNFIDESLTDKTLMFPVLNLLKLFLIINSNISPKKVLEEYKELYEEIKKYKAFLTYELLEIFEIMSLFFEDEYINDGEWVTNYNNPMTYQILASRFYAKERYVEAIFFSLQAIEIMIEDQNFKRYLTVNHTLMSSLLYAGNYQECYNRVEKHYYCINSLNLGSSEINITEKYLYVSLLGLKEYNRIIKDLINRDDFNLTLLTCLLVALHSVSKKDLYKKYIDENIKLEEFDEDSAKYLKLLIYYLSHRDYKILKNLGKHAIMGSLINILKKI